MESPKKFNDCYFYYYSTCTKGDNCVFRHEPSALGCETMCSAWQQGKCLDKRCKLRHMELRKNRKQIPCYWENQPGGCRKKHCPFMHKNPDARTDGIAPSQPGALIAAQPISSVSDVAPLEPPAMNTSVPAPVPAPAAVPLLWQQQRQQAAYNPSPVVLDSAILGVLPGPSELLPRRVVAAHTHAHTHAHAHVHAHAHTHPHAHDAQASYAPLPVDPLVVNFEEESDNESAPSSTPTKTVSPDDGHAPRTKTQELMLLERIQAEAAAYYSYDSLPRPAPPAQYDRLSLDELAGKQHSAEKRTSLDFRVLSLDEIRARKRPSESTTVIHPTPITLNLSRKRKLSTHETLTTSGNKILKVVRSNSVVYRKLDPKVPAQPSQAKLEQKLTDDMNSRKRTLSEQSDLNGCKENELVDNCYEFKRIKINEQTPKPRLIRNRSVTKSISESKDEEHCRNGSDSDTDVQFVSVEISTTNIEVDLNEDEVIDVDTAKMGDPVDVVDLCDELDDDPAAAVLDLDLDLDKNVPDVVASCQKAAPISETAAKSLISDIDAILNENS